MVKVPKGRRVYTLLPVSLAITAGLLILPVPAANAGMQEYVPDQLIIKFKPGVSSKRQKEIISAANGRRKEQFSMIKGGVVKPRSGVKLNRMRKLLNRYKDVAYVERDAYVTAFKTPNDPLFSLQYGLTPSGLVDIGADHAWDIKTRCSKVAVLDTGVDTSHPDLKDNLWKNKKEKSGNGRDDDSNGYIDDYYGVDLVDGRGSGIDDNGHGTHVAGIVAGKGNNGSGITGVCWSGNVMSVKFMNRNGLGATSGTIVAIEYAVNKGARVINASFGTSSKSKSLEDAVIKAKKKKALIVAASGNNGVDIDKSPVYPANFKHSNILVVAASTSTDTLASFSNYAGNAVDMAAPGQNIVSTYTGNRYASLSGTSMAAPMVAGAAGLLRARNTKASHSKLRSALRDTVDRLPAFNNLLYREGRLNLGKAIDKIK